MKHEIFNQYSWWRHKETNQIFIVMGVIPVELNVPESGLEVWILFEGFDVHEIRPLDVMLNLFNSKKIKKIINVANYS
jgi:hypothetical protein